MKNSIENSALREGSDEWLRAKGKDEATDYIMEKHFKNNGEDDGHAIRIRISDLFPELSNDELDQTYEAAYLRWREKHNRGEFFYLKR